MRCLIIDKANPKSEAGIMSSTEILTALVRAEQSGTRGSYTLQASIAACHARARTPEQPILLARAQSCSAAANSTADKAAGLRTQKEH